MVNFLFVCHLAAMRLMAIFFFFFNVGESSVPWEEPQTLLLCFLIQLTCVAFSKLLQLCQVPAPGAANIHGRQISDEKDHQMRGEPHKIFCNHEGVVGKSDSCRRRQNQRIIYACEWTLPWMQTPKDIYELSLLHIPHLPSEIQISLGLSGKCRAKMARLNSDEITFCFFGRLLLLGQSIILFEDSFGRQFGRISSVPQDFSPISLFAKSCSPKAKRASCHLEE